MGHYGYLNCFDWHYLPTHCPPKSQRSTPLAAGISVDSVRPPTRAARHTRHDLVKAMPLFSCSTTKRIHYKKTRTLRLPIALNHDTVLQTFSFHYQYSQLGIPFSQQMSCTQSRQSGANNNNVPNFCSHGQAQVTKFFFANLVYAGKQWESEMQLVFPFLLRIN